jgi:hypothetical protein
MGWVYLIDRLKEKSTWLGGATAISALIGYNVPDEKVQAAFMIVTFLLGILTAGAKEKTIK